MIFSIALNVGAYFLFPKFRIVLWPHKIVTALMPVPKTTVYDLLAFGRRDTDVLRFENADIAGELLSLIDESECEQLMITD